jgi:YesN/AraC family two-component response regulator
MAAKILIVDDEKDIRDFLEEFISLKFDAIVLTVATAAEALEKIQAIKHDLLITDIRMPDMSGIELISAIKLLPQDTAPDNILIMSGYISPEQVQILQEADVTAIVKPIDAEVLEEILNLHLRAREKKD